MASQHDETLRRFEDRLAELETAHYSFSLFVAGASDLSARAIANIRELFELQLPGRYSLEVVDVYRDARRDDGKQCAGGTDPYQGIAAAEAAARG